MRSKLFASLALAGALLVAMLAPSGNAVAAGIGTHQFTLGGVSVVTNQYKYVTATPFECDRAVDQSLCNAAFGVPKPSTLPPTPIAGNSACSLGRNLGPANPGPVGQPKVPCAGELTHQTDGGPQGCTEFTAPGQVCSFSGGSTWFYGYCGQTYGGVGGTDPADQITFHFSGADYKITRMGFTRPAAGVWEFSGKLQKVGNANINGFVRLYLSAVPNTPPTEPASNLAGCELGGLHSIHWQGTATVSDTELPTVLAAKKPGWHWCNGTDGC